jgi:hypothetical protein
MMKRTISSRLTPLLKFAPPILWIIWIGSSLPNIITSLLAHKALAIQSWLMLAAWIVGSPAIFWFCTKLKKVVIDYSGKLLISNYREAIEVKLEDIVSISSSTDFFSPMLVWFSLRRPSEFGEKIFFLPPWYPGYIGSKMLDQPVVAELRSLVSLAKDK